MDKGEYSKIIFSCFPRSGHHLLVSIIHNILVTHFNNKITYCEFYNCCNKFPCEKNSFICKNHDFENNIPYNNNFFYIVQYRRSTHMQMQSFYNCAKKYFDYKGTITEFITEKKIYYINWMNKWVFKTDLKNMFFLEYEELLLYPKRHIITILKKIYPNEKISNEIIDSIIKNHNIELKNEWNFMTKEEFEKLINISTEKTIKKNTVYDIYLDIQQNKDINNEKNKITYMPRTIVPTQILSASNIHKYKLQQDVTQNEKQPFFTERKSIISHQDSTTIINNINLYEKERNNSLFKNLNNLNKFRNDNKNLFIVSDYSTNINSYQNVCIDTNKYVYIGKENKILVKNDIKQTDIMYNDLRQPIEIYAKIKYAPTIMTKDKVNIYTNTHSCLPKMDAGKNKHKKQTNEETQDISDKQEEQIKMQKRQEILKAEKEKAIENAQTEQIKKKLKEDHDKEKARLDQEKKRIEQEKTKAKAKLQLEQDKLKVKELERLKILEKEQEIERIHAQEQLKIKAQEQEKLRIALYLEKAKIKAQEQEALKVQAHAIAFTKAQEQERLSKNKQAQDQERQIKVKQAQEQDKISKAKFQQDIQIRNEQIKQEEKRKEILKNKLYEQYMQELENVQNRSTELADEKDIMKATIKTCIASRIHKEEIKVIPNYLCNLSPEINCQNVVYIIDTAKQKNTNLNKNIDNNKNKYV